MAATVTMAIDLTVSPLTITPNNRNKKWQGMFCAEYTPKIPQPAIIAKTRIDLEPPNFFSVREPVRVAFVATNLGYHDTLKLSLCAGRDGDNWMNIVEGGAPHDAPEASDIVMNQPIEFSFPYPGPLSLVPKA